MPHDNHAPTGSGRFFAGTHLTDSIRAKGQNVGRVLPRYRPETSFTFETGDILYKPPPTRERMQPEDFVQNLDPERYSLQINRLKDPLQQLALIRQVTATYSAA